MARSLLTALAVAMLSVTAPVATAQEPDHHARAVALQAQAQVFQRHGRLNEAADSYRLAVDLLAGIRPATSPVLEPRREALLASLLHEYGWVEFQRRGPDAADALWTRGEAVATEAHDDVLRLRLSLSRVFVEAPGPDRRARIERGLAEARKLSHRELEGGYLQRLGEQQMWDGNYLPAAGTLRLAESTFVVAGREDMAARVLGPLGRLYRKHGRADLALTVHRRALQLLESHGTVEDRAWALAGIAGSEAALGRVDEARRHLARALTYVQSQRRAFDQIEVQRAFLELQAGRPALADRITRRIVEQGDPFAARLAWHPRAEALLALGHAADALAAIDRAIEATIEPSETPRLLLVRARALQALGRPHDALDATGKAIAVVERVRSDLIALDGLKQGYALFVEALFDFTVGLQVDLGMAREALDAAERGRSRAFLDLLMSRRDAAALDDPLPAAPSNTNEIASLAHSRPGDAATYIALARSLQSTVLAYWTGPDRAFVWTVTPPGEVRVTTLALGMADLDRLVERAIPRSAFGPTRGPGASEQTASTGVLAGATPRTAWRDLHDAIVAPVAERLPTRAGARVTIVPHGALSRIPFAAMIDERGRYLIERYEIHYVPSAAALRRTADMQAAPAASRVVIIGDPASYPTIAGRRLPALPGARAEVNAIASHFSAGDARTLAGRDARERAVRAALPRAAVLHFATHAVIEDDEPLDGFLALHPGGRDPADDGRLTVREIYGAEVNASLVVLSACRTASGRPAADGVAGFARAFLSAGVRRVVGGLWDVPDLTSRIVMDAFYSGEDRGTAAALRRAQLAVITRARAGSLSVEVEGRRVAVPEDPSLWAGFILLGEP